MDDHGKAILAVGLVLAFVGGVLGTKLLGAYQVMNGAKSGFKATASAMRAARLRWLIWGVVVFSFAWLWLHGQL